MLPGARQRPRGFPLGSQRLPGPSECKRRHLGGAPARGLGSAGTPLRGKGLHRHIGRLCSISLHRCCCNASGTGAGALPACVAPFGLQKGTQVSSLGKKGIFASERGQPGSQEWQSQCRGLPLVSGCHQMWFRELRHPSGSHMGELMEKIQ